MRPGRCWSISRSRTASAPTRFLGLLRTCINYPQIEFISQAKGRSLDSLSAELESRYQAAREVWLSEADQIKTCFGSATKWGNLPYNDDESMAALFEQLDTCFSESDTAFEALDCLRTSAPAALRRTSRKKAKEPVPEHRFFGLCEKLCKAEQIWLAGLQLAFVEYREGRTPAPQGRAQNTVLR